MNEDKLVNTRIITEKMRDGVVGERLVEEYDDKGLKTSVALETFALPEGEPYDSTRHTREPIPEETPFDPSEYEPKPKTVAGLNESEFFDKLKQMRDRKAKGMTYDEAMNLIGTSKPLGRVRQITIDACLRRLDWLPDFEHKMQLVALVKDFGFLGAIGYLMPLAWDNHYRDQELADKHRKILEAMV